MQLVNRPLIILALALLAAFGVQTRVMAKVHVAEKLASGVFAPNYDGNAPVDAAGSLDYAGRNAAHDYELVSGQSKWLSRDPIGERGGINLYGMVGNDPVNRVDMLGLINVKYLRQKAGNCGDFSVEWRFTLEHDAPKGGGYIVQQVTHKEQFWDTCSKMSSGGSPDKTTTQVYTEQWFVPEGKREPTVSITYTDRANRWGVGKTRGVITQSGSIKFVPSGTPAGNDAASWTSNNTGGLISSGILPATPGTPSWWNKPPTTNEPEASRSVTATWCCCGGQNKTIIEHTP